MYIIIFFLNVGRHLNEKQRKCIGNGCRIMKRVWNGMELWQENDAMDRPRQNGVMDKLQEGQGQWKRDHWFYLEIPSKQTGTIYKYTS